MIIPKRVKPYVSFGRMPACHPATLIVMREVRELNFSFMKSHIQLQTVHTFVEFLNFRFKYESKISLKILGLVTPMGAAVTCLGTNGWYAASINNNK